VTMDADALPGLDRRTAEAWLVAHVGAERPLRFQPLGNGKSNLTYRVGDAAGRAWVLRRPPLGALLPSAHDVAREHAVLSRLQDTPVPVPRMLALVRDAAVADAPVVVMEHVDGVVLDTTEAVARAASGMRRAVGRSLAETLGQIHAVDLEATGLGDLAGRRPYAERQVRRWLRQWESSHTREQPLVAQLAERLAQGAPMQREVTLLHGDYHLRNVVIDSQDGSVRAVLDWELCTLGDPLADLGGLLAYWPETDDEPIASVTGMQLGAGFPRRAELLYVYAAASGRDLDAVRYWETLACWKIAIIAEGVRRRRLDEPQNGTPIAVAAIDGLLERAQELADAAGV
jgi:aminoglycoside phosphotransferase (APT) family kinase protein